MQTIALAAVLFCSSPALHGYVRSTYTGGVLRRESQPYFLVGTEVVAGLRNNNGALMITAESDPVTALEAAAHTWNSVPNTAVHVSVAVTEAARLAPDNVDTISFEDSPLSRSVVGSAIAVTAYRYTSEGNIVESDIVFNPTMCFSTSPTPGCFDLQSVATHEMGHALGAGHSPLRSATMYTYTWPEEVWPRHLSSDDIAFVNEVFPAEGLQGGIIGSLAFSSGTSLSGAMVLVINPVSGFVVATYTAGAHYSTGGLPPGDYLVIAMPADPFDIGDKTGLDPPDWQASFYGGETRRAVTVAKGDLARADITVPDGPAKLQIEAVAFDFYAGGLASTLPSGASATIEVVGRGFSDTIRPEDIVIYGPGISIQPDSLQVYAPANPSDLGYIAFKADLAPQENWGDAVLTVRSGSLVAVHSALRILPVGPHLMSGGVVNAASFQPDAVAPGEIVSLLGSGLGPEQPLTGTLEASGRLATSLGGVVVEFDGQTAPLFYASSRQINAQVPFEVAPRERTRITVRYKDRTTDRISLVAPASIGVFGHPAIVNQDGSPNDAVHPAGRGRTIVVYGTGQGIVDPPLATGAPAPVSTLCRSALMAVTVADVPARVDFAGLTPGTIGLLQVNIAIPDGTPTGMVPLKLIANQGLSTGTAYIFVE